MSFQPDRVIYPEIMHLVNLEWPRDRWHIAFLSQPQKEAWYASRPPLDLIYESDQFLEWWKRYYLWPLKIKRIVFSLKFW